MNLVYTGKTKNVYALGDVNLRMSLSRLIFA